MTDSAYRQLRTRHADLAELLDRVQPRPGGGTARRLVQIYDGGAMPTANDHFFLSHPVELDGSEVEGGAGSPTADTNQTIVVDVIGSVVPSVGDLLAAYAIGGRWVAERGAAGGGGTVGCYPCGIPLTDLTLSWTNLLTGPGSTLLTYTTPPNIWSTGCVDGQLYELVCNSGQLDLIITYFISGFCPTGQRVSCSTQNVYPFSLPMTSYTCSPFSVTFGVIGNGFTTGCPEVEAPGYTTFTVTA